MKIVSTDEIFAEALQITLRQAGLLASILPALPASCSEEEIFIIDLDTLSPTAILPRQKITFSRDLGKGADFTRPFLLRELTQRLAEQVGSAAPQPPSDLPFLRLTPDGALLQGNPVALSPAERTLLALLMENAGACVPTEVIDGLWEEKGSNTTAVYIRYLRKKLDEPTGLRLIRTVRGRGYCLCLPE